MTGLRPPANAPSPWAATATRVSNPSSATAWTGNPSPSRPRRPYLMTTTISVAHPTTTDPQQESTMLIHPTLDKLHTLKCTGMAAALTEQMTLPDIDALTFEERLGLLVDREITERDNRRTSSRLRRARLKHNATLEDIDYRHPRGLDKSLMQSLASCQWVREHLNILITGPTGVGKTWLACALAHNACRHGYTALYLRLPRLLQDMSIAKGDGRYPKLLTTLAKTQALILDDWGLVKLNAEQRRDLLEILEDRHGAALHTRYQSITDRKMARQHRRPHPRRCHPRPPGAQCLQNQPQGRIHAKTEKNIDDDDPNRVIITNTHVITRLGVAALLRSGWQPSRETGGRIQ